MSKHLKLTLIFTEIRANNVIILVEFLRKFALNNGFQAVFPFTIYCLFKSLTILCEIWTIKRYQMAEMSDRVPNDRLGTSRLSHVFLKIYPYDPT